MSSSERFNTISENREKAKILYGSYKQLLYRAAFSLLKNEEDAEDAVQQLFFDMLRKGNMPDPNDERTRNYLIVAVKRKALDIIGSRREYTDLDSIEGLPDDQKKDLSPLAEAVASLPDKSRNLLIMYYYNGYKATEIAKLTGETANTVQKRLSRIRETLREIMEGKND